MKNNFIAKIDKTQQNSKCRLYGERDEMINHIRSKYSKFVQKEYKTRHDWVGKVIPWELCKKLKFDHMNKSYMPNPESIWKNETHKLLWDFEIRTDHLISARHLHQVIITRNKKKKEPAEFADHRIKLKGRELKKAMEHDGDGYANFNWCTWNNP